MIFETDSDKKLQKILDRTGTKDVETLMAKGVFIMMLSLLTLATAVVMNFLVLIFGWGCSVQSWGWIIFIWVCVCIVTAIKDGLVKLIKKI